MSYKVNFVFLGALAMFPLWSQAAGLFSDDPVLSCASSGSQHYSVDVSLFPKTIRVNGVYLEFQNAKTVNDGFKEGVYKQAYGAGNAGLAIRKGYKPVLIEHNVAYVCDPQRS